MKMNFNTALTNTQEYSAKQPLATVSLVIKTFTPWLKTKRNRNNNQKPSHSSFRQKVKTFSIAMVTVGHHSSKMASLGFLSFSL